MSAPQKIEIIEFMRFIAASAVVCVHLPIVGSGEWGVDLFFVISGFVMMSSTATGTEKFYVKRLIRILPIY